MCMVHSPIAGRALRAVPGPSSPPAYEPASVLASAQSLDLRVAFATEPPPMSFVAAGLKAGTVGVLASPGGVGKSFLSLEIAMAVAAPGVDNALLGLDIRHHGSVMVLNAEDPLDVLQERVYAIGQLLDEGQHESVLAQLRVTSLRGRRPNLLDERWVDAIARSCEDVRLLIIDTFSRFHTGDENDNAEMAEVISALEYIAERSGPAILVLHHTSKTAALNGQQAAQQSTRGASAIVDNARWQGYLEVMSERDAKELSVPFDLRRHFVRFGVSKQNYGRPFAPVWLARVDRGVLINANEPRDMQDAVQYVREIVAREKAAENRRRNPVYMPAIGTPEVAVPNEPPEGVW